MGPTKAVVKDNGLYDAVTGKLIQGGFQSPQEVAEYVNHHYVILPVVDKSGQPWKLDEKLVYCLRGSAYETVDDTKVHLSRCPDCGGMGVRVDDVTVDSDCIRCSGCGNEFDTRLEMMET